MGLVLEMGMGMHVELTTGTGEVVRVMLSVRGPDGRRQGKRRLVFEAPPTVQIRRVYAREKNPLFDEALEEVQDDV
jgi:hypothetical protein